MTRRNKLWINIDWITVLLFLILVILGWINIYASVYNEYHQSIFDISQRYGKQLIWIAAALTMAILILLFETNIYVFFSYFIYLTVILSLILVLLFGREINGSKSWFIIGDYGFQPSEFAKFATALALARFMSFIGFKMNSFLSMFGIAGILLVPVFFILLQNDTGSALVFLSFFLVFYREGMSGYVMLIITLTIFLFFTSLIYSTPVMVIAITVLALISYFVFNQKIKHFWIIFLIFLSINLITTGVGYFIFGIKNFGDLLSVGSAVGGIAIFSYSQIYRIRNFTVVTMFFIGSLLFSYSVDFVFNNFLEPYHQARINELLGISSDPKGIGYHVTQSKIAIGSGGMWGKGFLQGTQTKFDFVPEQSTDFIFCTVGEEWGFAGSFTIIGLFLFLLIRLIFLAERQRSRFSRIYGYSVAIIIFFHFVINIGMTIGIMPVIGIPLPFFSYGGSSLWSFTILLFIFIKLDSSRLEHLSG